MDTFNVNSYTTLVAQFNAVVIQTDAMLLSDAYEVTVDFVWSSPDLARGNASFLKVKFFIEEVLHQSIFTHKAAPMTFSNLEQNVVEFPYVPTSDIIAVTLHAKLNAIAGEYLEIIGIKIGSKFGEVDMSYTYADDEYPSMPSLKDWVGTDKYYYDQPWWFRNSPETVDYEVDENTDLTTPPEYDTVLEEIDSVVMGELKLREDGGEVIDINGWKPKIVKD
jgi:hypothetical protein